MRAAENLGRFILCHSTVPQPHDLGTFPTGIDCGGAVSGDGGLEQAVSWTLVRAEAVYDEQGNITSLTYHDAYTGSFSNPDNGKSVTWTQKDSFRNVFTTPGDPNTGTATLIEYQKISEATGRTVLTDSGTETLSFTPTGSTRVASTGHHPIDDYFYAGDTSGLAPLCRALA